MAVVNSLLLADMRKFEGSNWYSDASPPAMMNSRVEFLLKLG